MAGPNNTLEEKDMDGSQDAVQQNTVQQVPGELVDTGPMPLDVLLARMTLLERELLDRMVSLRQQLAEGAQNQPPRRLAQLVESLQLVEQRVEMVRQLRADW